MARVYAIASAKGGVGKTTTTANLGTVLAMADNNVLVVDGDLGMPNLASALGVEPDRATLHDVLTGNAPVSEAIYEGPAGLDVLPGSPALEAFAEAESTGLESIIPSLESQYDIIVIDTGAGLSNDTFVPMKLADEVLLVSTTERSALGDTEKTRQLAHRIGAETVGVVLTRVDQSNPNADEVASRLDAGVIAVVPEDSAIREALNSQAPAVLRSPESIASAGYRALAEALIGQPVPAPPSEESSEDESETESEAVETETTSEPELASEQTVVRTDQDAADAVGDDMVDSVAESAEAPETVVESEPETTSESDVASEAESEPVVESETELEPAEETETPSLSFDSDPDSHDADDADDDIAEADAIPFSSGSVSEPEPPVSNADKSTEDPAVAEEPEESVQDPLESDPDPLAEPSPTATEDEADPLESTNDVESLADSVDVADVTGGPAKEPEPELESESDAGSESEPESEPVDVMVDDPLAADAEPMGEPLHEETTPESTPEDAPEMENAAVEVEASEPAAPGDTDPDASAQESEPQTPEPAVSETPEPTVTDGDDEPLVAEAEPTESDAEVIEHEADGEDEAEGNGEEDGVYTTSLVEEVEALDDDESKEKKKGFFSRFLG